ncbi:UDP-N-acetylmuramate dehydrogenase [Marinomonas pollencensis]|uniref:UDP-N-acetylenolpyruvoylglucosamine reductase n=1 Tax=Marinomonas pollencensis TaxID=491954 RepID=A0A3E0DTE0_9GAMM|nr:UDP-N-acetylmuramate dehydrogenase [Marinomonas pollencensis]REG85766.1 UDP-N-acetylmuramate dehydrogenase [Marinomonas pollencensis]
MIHASKNTLSDMPACLQKGVSLSPFNTFRFASKAQFFAQVEHLGALLEVVAWAQAQQLPITVIGGGSNLLLCGDIAGLVIINQLSGVRLTAEDDDSVSLSVAAGEHWHSLVEHCVQQSWYGIENLALIPGTVGAAPVQNIGAYGVEVKDVIERVQVLAIDTGEVKWLAAQDCGFAYRDSHFKGKWQGRYIITEVELRLSKRPAFVLNYGGLKNHIGPEVSLAGVFETVCAVRRSKLPDPKELANAGSFFKNPVVSVKVHEDLLQRFPDLVSFPFGEGYKLAAGWLIDQAGWKGYRDKGVGVYKKQALVLVNYTALQASPLLELEALIQQSVFERYGVQLEREPVELPARVVSKEAES